MDSTVVVGVYRRLDNRLEGLDDHSPRALELHNRRKEALHDAFDADPAMRVTNWGDTDSATSHEYVEIAVAAAASATFHYAIVPGMTWLAQKIAEKAVDTALGELAKTVVSKLRGKQDEKKIQDFSVRLPDGTNINVDAPDQSATMTIVFRDGKTESVTYSALKN
jgi:hypothetical protein